MAGIYLHIPFCKQACHYCNFHFSTSLKYKTEWLQALLREIELQKHYLLNQSIETIYFGGGTPSLLSKAEILQIFEQLHRFYLIDNQAEITLEANPDDLSKETLANFRQTPINRFSIGIQSFHEADLRFMNRAHTATQATDCIQLAQDAGFHNLSIDLIYGTPTMNKSQWQQNLNQTIDLQIPHVSAYCLTVEPKTALAHFVAKGKVPDVEEEQSAEHFDMLVAHLTQNDFIHYEISNFCKKGYISQHNSAYWQGKPYLGLGPSAHSFNGTTRQWNVAHNRKYIQAISEGKVPAEIEQLSTNDRFNEYVMTSLRTIWGGDLQKIQNDFGINYVQHILKQISPFQQAGLVKKTDNTLRLTTKGRFVADGIIEKLFIV